jgi:hypothetical protein
MVWRRLESKIGFWKLKSLGYCTLSFDKISETFEEEMKMNLNYIVVDTNISEFLSADFFFLNCVADNFRSSLGHILTILYIQSFFLKEFKPFFG